MFVLCIYTSVCTAPSKSSGDRLVFMDERVGRHALLPPAAPSSLSSHFYNIFSQFLSSLLHNFLFLVSFYLFSSSFFLLCSTFSYFALSSPLCSTYFPCFGQQCVFSFYFFTLFLEFFAWQICCFFTENRCTKVLSHSMHNRILGWNRFHYNIDLGKLLTVWVKVHWSSLLFYENVCTACTAESSNKEIDLKWNVSFTVFFYISHFYTAVKRSNERIDLKVKWLFYNRFVLSGSLWPTSNTFF